MSDPYQTLGVTKSASEAEIKAAYRKLAKELHPDLHPGDTKVEDRFKTVSAAYDLLSDKDQRARYDRGEIDAQGRERPEYHFYRGQGTRTNSGRFGQGDAAFNAEDLFADLFSAGFARTGRTTMRGRDAEYTVTVSFREAAVGTTKRVVLPGNRTLDVNVPEGISDGQVIRLKGQGQPGRGDAPAGDALVVVKVGADPQFIRKGQNVHIELPIPIETAVLGGKLEVPTVHGPVTMTIPKGTNTGDTLRLKGKGIGKGKGRRRTIGDQYVALRIMLPDPPDPELTAAIERWVAGRTKPR